MTDVYTIRDLEGATGTPRTTIHFYLRRGLLPRPQKTAASRSLYTEEHADRLRDIAALKDQGLSLDEIGARLEAGAQRDEAVAVDLAALEYQRVHDRILALAAREFTTRGYRNTHVTAIMHESGITATLFYSHFSGKRRLLAECVSRAWGEGLTSGDTIGATAEDPAEGLLWTAFACSRAAELTSIGEAVVLVEGATEDEGLCAAVEDGRKSFLDRVAEALDRSDGDDPGRPLIPSALIASQLLRTYRPMESDPARENSQRYEDGLRAFTWLVLAARAARDGELDLDSHLAPYETLIARISSEPPASSPGFER